MERKNLPSKREINLFTSEKNVSKHKIKEVETVLSAAKKIKVSNAQGFRFLVYEYVSELNIDTFRYIVDNYDFGKVRLSNMGNKIMFTSTKVIKHKYFNVEVSIETEAQELNLMPNDIKRVIESQDDDMHDLPF